MLQYGKTIDVDAAAKTFFDTLKDEICNLHYECSCADEYDQDGIIVEYQFKVKGMMKLWRHLSTGRPCRQSIVDSFFDEYRWCEYDEDGKTDAETLRQRIYDKFMREINDYIEGRASWF